MSVVLVGDTFCFSGNLESAKDAVSGVVRVLKWDCNYKYNNSSLFYSVHSETKDLIVTSVRSKIELSMKTPFFQLYGLRR